LRLGPPLRTASASAEVIHPMMEGGEGPRELAVCLRRARGRSTRLCQGARESVPGRHAADGRARGGVWPRGRGPIGVRGARYSRGPSIGRAGAGRAHRPPSPMPRHAPRRMRGLEAGLPSERRRGRKKSPPPKGPRIYLGRTGYNPLSFKKKCPGGLPARRGCRATACTAPKTLSKRPALVRVCN